MNTRAVRVGFMVDKIALARCGFRDGQNSTGNGVDKVTLTHVWISWWRKWHWKLCGFHGG